MRNAPDEALPATTLPRRPLGRLGLSVSAIGFGSAPLGDLYQVLEEATALDAVAAALSAGITLFDTAPLYGHGLAEHRLGTILRGVPRDRFVLCSKTGRFMDPGRGRSSGSGYVGGFPHAAVIDYSRDGTLRSVEQSLLRLGLDGIDLLMIHDVDVWTHGAEAIEARVREVMEGAYPALVELRSQGVVRGIGIGVNEAQICTRFAHLGDFDAMMLAGRYSLLEQGALDEFLPLAERKGIGVMLGGVFNSGILATGPVAGSRYNYQPASESIRAKAAAIEAVCRAHNVRLADAALRFPLHHPAIGSVVLGAVTAEEVRRNIAALAVPIPAALWTDLREQGLLDPRAPLPA